MEPKSFPEIDRNEIVATRRRLAMLFMVRAMSAKAIREGQEDGDERWKNGLPYLRQVNESIGIDSKRLRQLTGEPEPEPTIVGLEQTRMTSERLPLEPTPETRRIAVLKTVVLEISERVRHMPESEEKDLLISRQREANRELVALRRGGSPDGRR